MAAAFPRSRVRRLRHLPATRSTAPSSGWPRPGSTNVRFVDPRDEPLPADGSVRARHHVRLHPRHDRPAGDDARRSAPRSPTTAPGCSSTSRRATRSPRTSRKNPMAALMYGISVLSCMSSAMSAPDGAGLGTLGLPASRAEAMAAEAGFARLPPARRRPRDQRVLRDPTRPVSGDSEGDGDQRDDRTTRRPARPCG